MKAQKLPSGSFRVQCRINGKVKSFTAPTEDEAVFMAMQSKMSKKIKNESKMTVGDCIDDYINSKTNVLSPSSIDSYKRIKKNNLEAICNIPVEKITEREIQILVNTLALSKSAKTVRNAHGFLMSVLNVYAPDLRIRTTLPQKQKKIKELPKVEEVFNAIVGSSVELPCLLALWGGMRMSEVRGAKKSDIHDGILTIHDVIVTVDGQHIEKSQTKTIDSTRRIRLSSYLLTLIQALPPEQNHLTMLTANAIYKRFSKLLEQHDIPHITFHDLRHLNASVMLALGIPDKYAMERGGWSSPHIMKSVYQHTFSQERQQADYKIDSFFESLLDKK